MTGESAPVIHEWLKLRHDDNKCKMDFDLIERFNFTSNNVKIADDSLLETFSISKIVREQSHSIT